MQLEVPLVIGYKCGAIGVKPLVLLLPYTVGYVHSEYLSCTNLHGLLQHKKYH